MAELPPFLTLRPGNEQGRVDPSGFEPTQSDWALVLGTDTEGWDRRFSIGDLFDVFQSETPAADAKLVRFRGRIRGPSGTMPAISDDEPATPGFVLADGQTLLLAVDGGSQQTITFATASFADITKARSWEVVDAINAQLVGAVAALTGTGAVEIRSSTTGRRSRIEILGGTATALNFLEVAWRFSLRIDGTTAVSHILRPGETRDLTDVGANLAAYTPPIEIRFRLEAVTV